MSRKKQKSLKGYIENVQGDLCKIVDIYLSELSNPEKIEGAPINQIASALGTIIEKFTKNSGSEPDNGMLEQLIADLKNDDSSTE